MVTAARAVTASGSEARIPGGPVLMTWDIAWTIGWSIVLVVAVFAIVRGDKD